MNKLRITAVTAITTLYFTLENHIQRLCVMADLIRLTTITHVVPTAKGWYYMSLSNVTHPPSLEEEGCYQSPSLRGSLSSR